MREEMGERRIGNPEGNRSAIGRFLSLSLSFHRSSSARFKVKRRIGRALFVSGTCGWTASVGRSRGYWSKVVEERVPSLSAWQREEQRGGRERWRETGRERERRSLVFPPLCNLSSSIYLRHPSSYLLPLQRNWNYRPKIEKRASCTSTPSSPAMPRINSLEIVLPLTLRNRAVRGRGRWKEWRNLEENLFFLFFLREFLGSGMELWRRW